ncbi:hypothetical protein [Streptomyces sp. NPDC002276]
MEKMEEAAGILALGLAGVEPAMTDMADGHIDNEELVRSMCSSARSSPLRTTATEPRGERE